MRIEYSIAFVCIAAIIIAGLGLGYDGVLAGTGVSAIVGIITWQGRKQADKKGGNLAATEAALKKAGFTEAAIKRVISKVKGGE
jgi:hypothetical protein